ncbi:MAG TPA: hypothetical protein VGD98_01495 [Ktedonobacteraceae bacterium]
MKKKLFFERTLPMYLSGLLLVIMLVTVFTQANNAALTTDEAMHASYGRATLAWYVTLGRDRSFLNYPLETYEPQHGAIFDAVVAAAQRVWHNQWQTEAVLIGLTGMLSVVALALCGLELGGWWFAWLAALSLWLYPRFFGAILNNPKDIPFTMANTFVLWSVLLLLRQWGEEQKYARNSLLVAFFLGVAIAVRVNAVIWYMILSLLLVGWWLLNWPQARKEGRLMRVLRQHSIICGLIGAGSLACTIVLWPYVFLNPFANLYDAIVVIAKYPWNGSVLFQGKMQLAVDLPRSYTPVWLVIGSPPLLLLCAALGLFVFAGLYLRKRALDLPMTLVLLAFAVPLSIIAGLHSVLYNGLRQFLFLVPPLILLAVYGMKHTLAWLWRRKYTTLLLLFLLAMEGGYTWTVKDMLDLHPYEYAYFSPLIGGIRGAEGNYELDYWNTCQKTASVWLGSHYQEFVAKQHPTIQVRPAKFQYMTFLPGIFQPVQNNADFLIDIPPFASTQALSHYRLIHTESVQAVPLCRVYVKSAAAGPLQPDK